MFDDLVSLSLARAGAYPPSFFGNRRPRAPLPPKPPKRRLQRLFRWLAARLRSQAGLPAPQGRPRLEGCG